MRLRKLVMLLIVSMLCSITNYPTAAAAPVSAHPRLWLTSADIPHLQSWAAASDPTCADGLLPALSRVGAMYNTNIFPGGQPNPTTGRKLTTAARFLAAIQPKPTPNSSPSHH